MPSRPHSHRHAARVLVVLAAFLLSLAASGPALAGSACGDKVIDDWYDGRIDGTYPLPCYDDAIKQLPRDLRDYSSAPDDIKRALQAAKRGKPAPPNKDPAPTDTRPDGTPSSPPNDDPPTTTQKTPTTTDPRPTDTIASPGDTGSSASSVPIPLLVLAGLALLLIAGGSAGYVVRRFQARHVPPPGL